MTPSPALQTLELPQLAMQRSGGEIIQMIAAMFRDFGAVSVLRRAPVAVAVGRSNCRLTNYHDCCNSTSARWLRLLILS
jgi:hypothetical protein